MFNLSFSCILAVLSLLGYFCVSFPVDSSNLAGAVTNLYYLL